MNWWQYIFIIIVGFNTVGCSSLFEEGKGPFRDKAKDYKHADASPVVAIPDALVHSRVYEPLMPIPGESTTIGQVQSADYGVDEKGDAIPWTLDSEERLSPIEKNQQIPSNGQGAQIKVASSSGEIILHEPFFRVWHQAALNAQEAGFFVLSQNESAGLLELRSPGVENIPSDVVFSISMQKLSDNRTKMSVISSAEENRQHFEQVISMISQYLS